MQSLQSRTQASPWVDHPVQAGRSQGSRDCTPRQTAYCTHMGHTKFTTARQTVNHSNSQPLHHSNSQTVKQSTSQPLQQSRLHNSKSQPRARTKRNRASIRWCRRQRGKGEDLEHTFGPCRSDRLALVALETSCPRLHPHYGLANESVSGHPGPCHGAKQTSMTTRDRETRFTRTKPLRQPTPVRGIHPRQHTSRVSFS